MPQPTDLGRRVESPVRRLRHPLVPRRLTVVRVEELTARMRRVVLGGPALAGFAALGPADHAKVFFPLAPGEPVPMPVLEGDRWVNRDDETLTSRDYTVRTFRPGDTELTLDFVVHEHGPAGRWAAQARVGFELGVLGPRGSAVPPLDRARYVLAADETGVPALLNWLDRLPATAHADVLVEVHDAADHLPLPARARTSVTWLHRGPAPAGTTTLLADAVAALDLAPGDLWAWAGAEATAVRAIRSHLAGRGIGPAHAAMTGYWRRGTANFDHHSPEA